MVVKINKSQTVHNNAPKKIRLYKGLQTFEVDTFSFSSLFGSLVGWLVGWLVGYCYRSFVVVVWGVVVFCFLILFLQVTVIIVIRTKIMNL